MFDSLLVQFVVLWAVIDPIGSVPVFLAKTAGLKPQISRKIARKAIIISACILLFFLLLGQILLELMQIPLSAFQIAGGLVLLIFAFTMIFGDGKPETEIKMASNWDELAVYPLAVPSIASPGAMMAVVLLTDNHRFHIFDQFVTALIMLSILVITLGFFYAAGFIQKIIGRMGASVISRIMGLILSAVAVNNILDGIYDFFINNVNNIGKGIL
ncbi:MAG: MarC family protein [Cardiobacteriaceae bacterium]|nr:MarC family protein [Cardiobacteriaceae bacterium]